MFFGLLPALMDLSAPEYCGAVFYHKVVISQRTIDIAMQH
jgi:hypothetical protein